jgi:anti-anti-sigma factor
VCAEPPTWPSALETTAIAGTVTVVLRGEFDMTSRDLLAGYLAQITRTAPRRLVFEMAQVAYLDVASARLIAGTGRWLPVGVKPVIRRPSPIVRRVLEVSGVDVLCDLEPEF